jgi:hypothetical protein
MGWIVTHRIHLNNFASVDPRGEVVMKKNMGNLDRGVRTILALVVLYLYLSDRISGVLAVVLGIFAIVFLVTSAIGFCPGYVPLKISTAKKQ